MQEEALYNARHFLALAGRKQENHNKLVIFLAIAGLVIVSTSGRADEAAKAKLAQAQALYESGTADAAEVYQALAVLKQAHRDAGKRSKNAVRHPHFDFQDNLNFIFPPWARNTFRSNRYFRGGYT